MKSKAKFEAELKNKLALKSTGKQSEESLICKAFKYFDLDNSGECDPSEFSKALAKLGVTGFSEEQVNELFSLYDKNKNGSLDYKEFASSIYSEEEEEEEKQKGGKNDKKGGDTGLSDEAKEKLNNSKVMDKFREKIKSRGGTGMIGLARQFKIFDDDRTGTLNFYELNKAVQDFGVGLTEKEVKILFNIMDPDGSGEVSYDEFLREIRGDMNKFRTDLVNKAFKKLDTDGSGKVEMGEIEALYNCKKHPDVIKGKKTEREVYQEFMTTFQQHASTKGKGTIDDTITREEFQEYYENISMSIDRDDYFELMMNNCWKLNEKPSYEGKAAWTDKNDSGNTGGKPQSGIQALKNKKTNPLGVEEKKAEPEIDSNLNPIEKFREACKRRGARGIMSLKRTFMIADDNGDKTIDPEEFKKLCRDYRVPVKGEEISAIFKKFDRDRSGTIDYDEFLKGVVGDMNSKRVGFVKRAFKILDKSGDGKVDLDDIRGVYNAKMHPDVKSGKKTEDEILGEFLDTFEYHFSLLNDNSSKDRSITEEEFIEYYNNISMSIERDDYFELMITRCWNMDGVIDVNKKKGVLIEDEDAKKKQKKK